MSHRSDCRLYVGNLPANIKEYEIEDLFKKYGRVNNVDLKQPRNGRGLPFAFVEMDHRRDADDAVNRRNGYSMDGYRLRVEFPKGSYSRNTNQRSSSFVPRKSKNSVSVSGLPPTGSWQDLKDHMRDCGDIAFADVFGGGKGVVSFMRKEDMQYAVKKLNESKFRSHKGESAYIKVTEDDQRDSRSRSGSSRSPVRSKKKRRRSPSSSSGSRSRMYSKSGDRRSRSRSGKRSMSRSRSAGERSASVNSNKSNPVGEKMDVTNGSPSRSCSKHSDTIPDN